MQQGMVKEAREMVIEAISSRFDAIPEDIVREVSALDNRMVLKRLLREAIVCPDLTRFREVLASLGSHENLKIV